MKLLLIAISLLTVASSFGGEFNRNETETRLMFGRSNIDYHSPSVDRVPTEDERRDNKKYRRFTNLPTITLIDKGDSSEVNKELSETIISSLSPKLQKVLNSGAIYRLKLRNLDLEKKNFQQTGTMNPAVDMQVYNSHSVAAFSLLWVLADTDSDGNYVDEPYAGDLGETHNHVFSIDFTELDGELLEVKVNMIRSDLDSNVQYTGQALAEAYSFVRFKIMSAMADDGEEVENEKFGVSKLGLEDSREIISNFLIKYFSSEENRNMLDSELRKANGHSI